MQLFSCYLKSFLQRSPTAFSGICRQDFCPLTSLFFAVLLAKLHETHACYKSTAAVGRARKRNSVM